LPPLSFFATTKQLKKQRLILKNQTRSFYIYIIQDDKRLQQTPNFELGFIWFAFENSSIREFHLKGSEKQKSVGLILRKVADYV